MKKYYGLRFPELPLASEEIKKQLAREMFLHPHLNCDSVRDLLSNSEMLEKVFLTCSRLECNIQDIALIKEEPADEVSLWEAIISKIQDWAIEFSFPTIEELVELSDHHVIPLEVILQNLMKSIREAEMSTGRITDFLRKYTNLLYPEQIDNLLDLINERKSDEN